MEAPNIIVSIAGEPKTGKSHLALTFPEPIKVFSFDIGLAPILAKFPDKAIDVEDFSDIWLDRSTQYAKELYARFKKTYEEAQSGDYNTLVIDTATSLWEIVRHSVALELNQDSIMQYQYGEPNTRMIKIIHQPRILGINLVLTHYLGAKFVKNEETNELKARGFSQAEGLVDIVLWLDLQTKLVGKDKKNIVVATMKRNRYDLDLNGQSLDMATYDDLIALLGV